MRNTFGRSYTRHSKQKTLGFNILSVYMSTRYSVGYLLLFKSVAIVFSKGIIYEENNSHSKTQFRRLRRRTPRAHHKSIVKVRVCFHYERI